MNRIQKATKATAWLPALLILAGLTVTNSTVRAEGRRYDDSLAAGMYNGTFAFTVEHTYDAPTQEMPMNYYSLRAEEVVGTIRFRADGNGKVSGISVRVPSFNYNVVASQTVTVPKDSQGEWNCTGSSSYAAGMGTVSGGSGLMGAPPLVPASFDFYTKPVKFDPGDPWGRVSLTGKCPVKGDSKAFIEMVKWDINSLPSNPWTFKTTWQGFQSAGGTCSNGSWLTANRSISCNWAAYSGGYRRKTAPG